MVKKYILLSMLALSLTIVMINSVFSQDEIELWPENVPGLNVEKSPSQSKTNEGVTRITIVTNPLMAHYTPSLENDNGHAIVICPGGGYNILAYDLEGSEIANWLTGLGYTTYVLEYRVPKQREGALQDVQRALRVARSSLEDNGKLGVLGFSAGGHLSASAATRYNERTYPEQDHLDELSARPDFAVLVYPAYLDGGEGNTLSPEINLTDDTPPMFIFETADDPYGNSALVMAGALRNNKTHVTLHFTAEGGHGYGIRRGEESGLLWPKLCERWLDKIVLNAD